MSIFSFDRQNCINLLILLVFFLLFSSAVASGTVSNLSLLPLDEPGMSRFRLAKLARFHACWLFDLEVDGSIMECERCSVEERVPALLENRGNAALEMLSLSDGRSSFDARSTKSGLGSFKNRLGRERVSNEMWSTSGDDIIEADVVRPSVEDA